MLAFVFATLLAAVVMAGTCKTKDELVSDNLNVRYDFYYFRAEVLRERMEVVIENTDGDTSELEAIKDEFVGLYEDAKTAADAGDADGFEDVIDLGGDLVREFKQAANGTISNRSEIVKELNETMQENQESFEALYQKALDDQLAHRLDVIDQSICNSEDFIAKKNISNESVDAALVSLEAQGQEVEDALNSAYEACGLKRLAICEDASALAALDLMEDYREAAREFRQTVKEALKAQLQEKVQQKKGNQSTAAMAEKLNLKKGNNEGSDGSSSGSNDESQENEESD